MIFGKKNPRETVPEVAMRQGGTPAPLGACCKKSNIWIEIVLKFQPNRSYGSPGI